MKKRCSQEQVFVTAAWVTGLAATLAVARPGEMSCFSNNNGDACAHYHDPSPECPDSFFGGGTCGNPAPAKAGK